MLLRTSAPPEALPPPLGEVPEPVVAGGGIPRIPSLPNPPEGGGTRSPATAGSGDLPRPGCGSLVRAVAADARECRCNLLAHLLLSVVPFLGGILGPLVLWRHPVHPPDEDLLRVGWAELRVLLPAAEALLPQLGLLGLFLFGAAGVLFGVFYAWPLHPYPFWTPMRAVLEDSTTPSTPTYYGGGLRTHLP